MRIRSGLKAAIAVCFALSACSSSRERIAADQLRDSVALRASDEAEAESDRLAGRYALTPIGNEDGRWCDLLFEPADGDDFIGFQGVWFGPGCERRFPMLTHIKGWGPSESGVALYSVDEDTLDQKTLEFTRTVDGDFRGVADGVQYRLKTLEGFGEYVTFQTRNIELRHSTP